MNLPDQRTALFVTTANAEQNPRREMFDEAGVHVEYRNAWPDSSDVDDGIILASRAVAQQLSMTPLRSYVASGGNLLMLGGIPYFLCGISLACLDWFGPGARYGNVPAGATAAASVDAPLDRDLVVRDAVITGTYGPSAARIYNWAQDAEAGVEWMDGLAFVLVGQSEGGRVAFMSNRSHGNERQESRMREPWASVPCDGSPDALLTGAPH